jgi:hypothetical protein
MIILRLWWSSVNEACNTTFKIGAIGGVYNPTSRQTLAKQSVVSQGRFFLKHEGLATASLDSYFPILPAY